MPGVDTEEMRFEQYGLLKGLSGEPRSERLELLEELRDDGFSLEELREAAQENRLALLRIQRDLGGETLYSVAEVAERAGLDRALLERLHRSVGMVAAEGDELHLTEEDLEAAVRARKLMDAGLADEAVLSIGRVIAVSMSQFAAAVRQAVAESVIEGATTETQVARRLEEMTRKLAPEVAPLFDHAFRLHMRQQLQHVAVDLGDGNGEAREGDPMAVGFADLVDFTQLGDQVPPEELGRVTGRLDALAREVAGGSVRLVKMIGDAAMFSSPEPERLASALLDLLDSAEAQGDEFPVLRAGMAVGPLVERAGDLFGREVNMAHRLTGIARPGSLLVNEACAEAIGEGEFELSDAGRKRLKGFSDRVRAYRVRRLEADDAEDEEA